MWFIGWSDYGTSIFERPLGYLTQNEQLFYMIDYAILKS